MTSSQEMQPYPYDKPKAVEILATLKKFDTFASKDQATLRAMAGCSPYLAAFITKHPEWIETVVESDGAKLLTKLLDACDKDRPVIETKEQLMAFLRRSKAELAFLTAWHDVSEYWTLDQVTQALTRFADAAIALCLAHSMQSYRKRRLIDWNADSAYGAPDYKVGKAAVQDCGYFVLAMGKQGGFELNYSSDVDLIIFYDPDKICSTGRKSLPEMMVRVTRDIVQMMEQRTSDGYVFRTDLRLRPDPGANPLAITTQAAEYYYHSIGQNWERSAMIKARPIAGDMAAADEFMAVISPWIWRRHLDFEALRDIQSIKNRIKHQHGQETLAFNGYDVKVGPGGIREIEFFAQINQLLHGGRNPRLRTRRTLDTLEQLCEDGRLAPKILSGLTESYQFLRVLEHRIQMVNDEQTHQIPVRDDDVLRLAAFLGYTAPKELEDELKFHTTRVKAWYDGLLPAGPDEDEDNDDNDREIDLGALLTQLDFPEYKQAYDIIEGWRRGRYKALKTPRARLLLERCLPGLLGSFRSAADPMSALTRFDNFLGSLPAGVQLFSLFQSNPNLFKLVARIMGSAPGLAKQLAKKPTLWEAVLEPEFYAPLADACHLREELKRALSAANDYQDILDISRVWVAEKRFQLGVQIIENITETLDAGRALSNVADIIVGALVAAATREFERRHGCIKGGEIAIIAMGKYGGQALSYTSDLDVVMLYKVDDAASVSNGERQVSPSQYYSRLGQSIITALTVMTAEGTLFEVDTRLRPSGNQGPLIVTLETFTRYYSEAAWTWEHMALTRGRVVVAGSDFKQSIQQTIRSALNVNRNGKGLKAAVLDMRSLMAKEMPARSRWSMKHSRGGLVDIEFIVQYLLLANGQAHLDIIEPVLETALIRLRDHGLLSPDDYRLLDSAHAVAQSVQAILRVTHGSSSLNDTDFSPELQHMLCRATGAETFSDLKRTLETQQQAVYQLFERMIGTP